MASYQPKHAKSKPYVPQHLRPALTRPVHAQSARFAPRPRARLSVRAKGLAAGTMALGTGAVVVVMSTVGAQGVDNSPRAHHVAPTTTSTTHVPKRSASQP
jgi:hypothetical protein